jgi:hypothetical protein
MRINRKTFLQSLAAIVAWPFISGAKPTALPLSPPMETIVLPPEPEIWLKEWLSAMRMPILDSEDPKERFFIRALRLNQPVDFAYFGGTQFGRVRHVHPVMMYRVGGYSEVYFTGYCEARQEIRTFRLDRIKLDHGDSVAESRCCVWGDSFSPLSGSHPAKPQCLGPKPHRFGNGLQFAGGGKRGVKFHLFQVDELGFIITQRGKCRGRSGAEHGAE